MSVYIDFLRVWLGDLDDELVCPNNIFFIWQIVNLFYGSISKIPLKTSARIFISCFPTEEFGFILLL